jgi:hypothetical protein
MSTSQEDKNMEALKSLLKEKAKELKVANKKLNKLEIKTVEFVKKEKLLKQDRETFIQFLHLIFP